MDSRELWRKLLHIGVGLLAFTLGLLGPLLSAALLGGLLLLNLTLLPRFGSRWLWRSGEPLVSTGIVAYPAVLFVLQLIFWHRLEIVATVWAMFAFGDGMASIVGRSMAGSSLPWNPRKSWPGVFAYWGFGALGAAAALELTLQQLGRPLDLFSVAMISVISAGIAACIESQPQGLDDNITVPPVAAVVLWGLLESVGWQDRVDPRLILLGACFGLAANVGLGWVALRLGAIDVSGVIAGTVLGTLVCAFLGWRGFAVLALFVTVGSAVSRLGSGRSQEDPSARELEGKRSARHAVANMGVAVGAGILAVTTPHEALLMPAFVAALAGALSDTVSSEVGPLVGGPVVLITTFETVRAGTDGGISLGGTVVGALASAGVASLGWALGLFPAGMLAWVALAGMVGNVADSLAGALLERRGLLDNEGVNFLATGAASTAIVLAAGC